MKHILICCILVSFLCIDYADAIELESDAVKLEVQTLKSEYKFGEPLIFDIRLINVGEKPVSIERHLKPEGWRTVITIEDPSGNNIYSSSRMLRELSAGFLKAVDIEQDYFFGARFTITKTIPPGEYVVYATYDAWKISNEIDAITGLFKSGKVSFKVIK